ncbi:lipoate--protein ligase [Pseudoflavonifractor sp. MSJ-37]|uniref:lipoate--protein ligase family protein n=1 Tax=Pseudoflavonifractor sp. MSJ-37 TaxID=2841531 RepID=UPI001C122C23|nr:lipoate--protein ligase [Pseudoflavonifractor sp. MSJ-37]MBU5434270.1 lipoate--protein ligase [Pseudoflavonifractor sp. MSJ-37]
MLTIQNVSHDPFYNQAFEEFVFQTFTDDDVFLLWQNSPAVIVGSYQNICHEVQIGALRRKGIPVVRRISGGGTVYHDLGNVNYTYITQTNGAVDYDAALGPVIAALNAIGVPARKDRVCDIAIGDQKISGSAQRMVGGRLLHHGTLLFSSDLTALERITHQKNDCVQSKGTQSAICTVTNIRDHLTVPMTIEAFQANLLDQMVPPDQPRMTLTPEQESEVCRLRDEKYRSWDWTWGKTPAFTYDRSGIFAGVPIHVTYRAKHGIISDAVLDCAVLDGSLAARSLNGARLDPDVFAAICRRLAGGAADELLDLLL